MRNYNFLNKIWEALTISGFPQWDGFTFSPGPPLFTGSSTKTSNKKSNPIILV